MSMNYNNLHELINRYENGLDNTMGTEHREQFKWEAVKCFRDAWFSELAKDLPFPELFNRARKGCGWLVDNSRISPTSGVVKMAEIEPDTIKALFTDLLFSNDDGDLKVRQQHMDDFIDQIEALRIKHFPKHWKYKHERHAASCYLTFFSPETNFIYRFSDADMMAKYIGFEKPLGSGQYFDLEAYYEMCEMIVAALKEHPTLLASHQARQNDACYKDESLHLMAFDLMYCCRCYGYYHGLNYALPTKSKTSKATKSSDAVFLEKRNQLEALIAEQEEILIDLQSKLAGLEEVSLIGTEVSTSAYGVGTVSSQSENKITVRFENITKDFIIHRKYPARPRFEDEEQIVSLLSDRADCLKQMDETGKKIARANKQLESI